MILRLLITVPLGLATTINTAVWQTQLSYCSRTMPTFKDALLVCCLPSDSIKGEVLRIAGQYLEALRAALLNTLVPSCRVFISQCQLIYTKDTLHAFVV